MHCRHELVDHQTIDAPVVHGILTEFVAEMSHHSKLFMLNLDIASASHRLGYVSSIEQNQRLFEKECFYPICEVPVRGFGKQPLMHLLQLRTQLFTSVFADYVVRCPLPINSISKFRINEPIRIKKGLLLARSFTLYTVFPSLPFTPRSLHIAGIFLSPTVSPFAGI